MLKFKKIKQNTTNPEQKKKNKSRMVLVGSFFSSALFAFSLDLYRCKVLFFLQTDFLPWVVLISQEDESKKPNTYSKAKFFEKILTV